MFDISRIHGKASKLPVSWNGTNVLQQQVLSFLQKNVLPHVSGVILLYTSIKATDKEVGNVIKYNCHPQYNKTDYRKQPTWHDWANVTWPKFKEQYDGMDVLIPAHIMIVFEIMDLIVQTTPKTHMIRSIKGCGNYMLIHSLVESIYTEKTDTVSLKILEDYDNYLCNPVTNMVDWSRKEQQLSSNGAVPKLWMVHVNQLHSPCIVVPYNFGDRPNSHCTVINMNVQSNMEWLIIEPIHQWKDLFLEEMSLRTNKG